jgi:murein DD-endopeptidase MepM/ murein hydrolase activator NlpD
MASIIGTPYKGTHSLGNWESDNAYDIALPKGTPLRAVVAGRIGVSFGYNLLGGWRLHLIGGGTEFYYAHLSRYAFGILPGRLVKQGQVIAYSGDSGNARGTTPHLHFAKRPPGSPEPFIGALTGGGGASVPAVEFTRGSTGTVPTLSPRKPGEDKGTFDFRIASALFFAGNRTFDSLSKATAGTLVRFGVPRAEAVGRGRAAASAVLADYQSRIDAAANEAIGRTGFFGALGLEPATNIIGALGSLILFLSKREGWIRVGEIIGGVIVLYLALRILARQPLEIGG